MLTYALFIILSGVRLSPLGTAVTIGLLYQLQMIGDGICGSNWWNGDWQAKPKYSEKTCPSATLPITNPTRLGPGLQPGPPWWEASD
jgi:hypothetical protein